MLPKCVVSFVLLAVSSMGECRAALEAGCKLETLGACGDDYIPFGNTDHLAPPGKGFEDRCATEKRQAACTLRFADDCLEGVSQTAALVAMTSLRDTINTVCTAGSVTYEEFQRAGPCLNSTGAEIHACFQDLKGTLQRAVATAPAKEVIPHSCCAYSDVVECIGRALLPCEGAGARDYFLGLMDRVMGKALKLVCIDYASGSAACKMLPKLPPLVPEDRNMGNYIQLIIEVANTIES